MIKFWLGLCSSAVVVVNQKFQAINQAKKRRKLGEGTDRFTDAHPKNKAPNISD
jgi:hypothetical protein